MKISLILPYWDRQTAADLALSSIAQVYPDLDLEIIVVDDGNRIPFRELPLGPDIRVLTLPRKDEPKSPVTCWNAGVKAATGDVVVISCIEVIHAEPVLKQLATAVMEDANAYVLASAWCPEEEKWHTHSTVTVPDCPPVTGLGVCAALRPELYWRAGGWDEDYREGAGYEDRDWIKRLVKAGAKFTIRDDLSVIHPKTNAWINWGMEKFRRNFALYHDKWFHPVAVTCVEVGNYAGRGERYVRTLKRMVDEHLTISHNFYCLTDRKIEGIECIPADPDLKGWWQKLYLFAGHFREPRAIFFDLDTFILRNIDLMADYRGELAMLGDFWTSNMIASGVMAWDTRICRYLWAKYVEQNKPQPDDGVLGDRWWIQQNCYTCDILQHSFPGMFVSYKGECLREAPREASVCCFHGKPRPHEAKGWAKQIWGK